MREAEGDAIQAMAGPAKIGRQRGILRFRIYICVSTCLSGNDESNGLAAEDTDRMRVCSVVLCLPPCSLASHHYGTNKGKRRANGQELNSYQHGACQFGYGIGYVRLTEC